MMRVSLVPATASLWSIRRSGITLFREMTLGAAIKLAREVARDEHLCSGRDTCVEMPGVDGPILLALHVRVPGDAKAVASDDSVAA